MNNTIIQIILIIIIILTIITASSRIAYEALKELSKPIIET